MLHCKLKIITKTHLEFCQRSTMERFCTLTISPNKLIDVWQGPKQNFA